MQGKYTVTEVECQGPGGGEGLRQCVRRLVYGEPQSQPSPSLDKPVLKLPLLGPEGAAMRQEALLGGVLKLEQEGLRLGQLGEVSTTTLEELVKSGDKEEEPVMSRDCSKMRAQSTRSLPRPAVTKSPTVGRSKSTRSATGRRWGSGYLRACPGGAGPCPCPTLSV